MVENADTLKEVLNYLRENMPVMEQSWRLLNADIQELKEIVKQNNRALRGTNGEAGLVSDVTSLCVSHKELKDEVKEISDLLHKGSTDEPGLVELVRRNRDFRKNVRYWYILLIGATLVGLVNILLEVGKQLFVPGG